jgi:hypothetical protein
MSLQGLFLKKSTLPTGRQVKIKAVAIFRFVFRANVQLETKFSQNAARKIAAGNLLFDFYRISLTMTFFLISLIVSIVFSSCNPNKSKDKAIEVFENVDSTTIASDTITEKAIESSYEYAKSLPVSEKLVFDVRGYGGPASHGEYAILRRGADNKPDTVAHGERDGVIANSFTADLNKNGNPEVYIDIQAANGSNTGRIIGYEFDMSGKATSIQVEQPSEGLIEFGLDTTDKIVLHMELKNNRLKFK